MIFREIPTLQQRFDRIETRQHDWGIRLSDFEKSPEGKERARTEETGKYQRLMAQLLQADSFVTLADACTRLGMGEDEYRALARSRQAILVSAENATIERVPVWALMHDEPRINTLATAIAIDFAAQRADHDAVDFRRFMEDTTVTLNMKAMDETLPAMGPVRQSFADVSPWTRRPEKLGLTLALCDAIDLGKNNPESPLYRSIHAQARRALGMLPEQVAAVAPKIARPAGV